MWIAVGLGIAVLCLAVRYRMLKKCISQAGRDLASIMDNPDENRILLAALPSREAERLLQQVNRYIEFHQRERIIWRQRERRLQEQIENISHDLRTPLISILGYLELLDGSRLSGEDQEALERILHNMIQNVLRYARSYFRICVYRAEGESGQEYANESGGDGRGAGDAQAGGAGCIAGENQICLDFSNDTEQLTQADIPCLFDRFYRADHARPSGSTGLGLTVSKLLAEAMGGAVTAQLTEQRELHLIYTFQAGTDPAGM